MSETATAGAPHAPLVVLDDGEVREVSASTIAHYEQSAVSFWEGTRHHDVSQNVAALLRHINAEAPYVILDIGCGPGRDLKTFCELGHTPVGLDGSAKFVQMARAYADVEVLQQDFLALDLTPARFDGVFANAVLFHVPTQELPRVLAELHAALKPGGVFFASNPRGPDVERYSDMRYGSHLCWQTWTDYVTAAGFAPLEHYYRPPGLPRDQQQWLASVWRA
jgi:SAM-dependent methyltransferase